jgi:hypothetical protein
MKETETPLQFTEMTAFRCQMLWIVTSFNWRNFIWSEVEFSDILIICRQPSIWFDLWCQKAVHRNTSKDSVFKLDVGSEAHSAQKLAIRSVIPCFRLLAKSLHLPEGNSRPDNRKFLAFYRTWRLITVFTRASHPSLCWGSSVPSRTSHSVPSTSIFKLIFLPCLGFSSCLFPSGSPVISVRYNACYVSWTLSVSSLR